MRARHAGRYRRWTGCPPAPPPSEATARGAQTWRPQAIRPQPARAAPARRVLIEQPLQTELGRQRQGRPRRRCAALLARPREGGGERGDATGPLDRLLQAQISRRARLHHDPSGLDQDSGRHIGGDHLLLLPLEAVGPAARRLLGEVPQARVLRDGHRRDTRHDGRSRGARADGARLGKRLRQLRDLHRRQPFAPTFPPHQHVRRQRPAGELPDQVVLGADFRLGAFDRPAPERRAHTHLGRHLRARPRANKPRRISTGLAPLARRAARHRGRWGTPETPRRNRPPPGAAQRRARPGTGPAPRPVCRNCRGT